MAAGVGGGGGGGGGWGDGYPSPASSGLSIPYDANGLTFPSGGSIPTPGKGVYWIGQDNNVYVKGDQGTNSAGIFDNNSDSYWSGLGYSKIGDPNVSSGAATYNPSRVVGGIGGGGGTTAQQADFVNQSYDTKIGGLRSILDTLNPQQDVANANVLNQYTNQQNTLKSQQAIGERNLNLASDQVQAGRVKGLADLGRQVQTLGRSYANQLGSYGAGDSSATGLINQALSGMASRNRSDVVGNASQQQQSIDLQRGDLGIEMENNMKMLDDWKSSTLNDIATKFTQQKSAIQQQMINADADRYQALAQLDASYTQQAINQLAALEGQYRQSATDLIGQYQNMQGPNVGIASNLQQFAVQPISAGRIQQLSMVPTASSGNQPASAALRRPFDETYGFGL